MFKTGSRPERCAAMGDELFEDGDYVIWTLALTEHDLGKAGAKAAVVVDSSKAEIGKRELGEPGHGCVDVQPSSGDLRQEFM